MAEHAVVLSTMQRSHKAAFGINAILPFDLHSCFKRDVTFIIQSIIF